MNFFSKLGNRGKVVPATTSEAPTPSIFNFDNQVQPYSALKTREDIKHDVRAVFDNLNVGDNIEYRYKDKLETEYNKVSRKYVDEYNGVFWIIVDNKPSSMHLDLPNENSHHIDVTKLSHLKQYILLFLHLYLPNQFYHLYLILMKYHLTLL